MYLNCHSWFSLKYGTLSPEHLVDTAADYGVDTLALTDINNTSCAVEFISRCQDKNIKPVIGIEFRNGAELLFIGLAKNNRGFQQLNELLTTYSFHGKTLPAVPNHFSDVFIIYPKLIKQIDHFKENEFLGIRPEHAPKLWGKDILNHKDKLVAWSPVVFADPQGYKVHKILRAIDQNTLITKLKPGSIAKPAEVFYTKEQFEGLYRSYPFLISNAGDLLQSCTIDLPASDQNNRQIFTNSVEGDYELLKKLSYEGVATRYGSHHRIANERLEKELRIIKKQGYCTYFLITWDTIRYAAARNYAHIGRGSGANSIVAYALYITDVDPLCLNLPFERFINEFRSSPPDFDIDFSHQDRDDVIDYLFKRYGHTHCAMLAVYSTFKGRSVILELGKVFGLPKPEIDQIVADPFNAKDNHELAKTILHYAPMIEGAPNYLSIHAGGIVISQQPLTCFTALKMMPKGVPITHFDMYHAEDWGFHKYDILSQRGLGHIKDTIQLIKDNRGLAVDVDDTNAIMHDSKVKDQLRSARCIGSFYIESPAMRQLLTKLKCDDYLQLVAASSIIRPGVSSSGMMAEYIKRRHDPYSFDYLHPVFEEELKETYGVMVYQEDVMKIAHAFAGIPLDECDVLRRIMSGKKAKDDTFERLRDKFFQGCQDKGYSDALAKEVWRQISSFAGYSFCKAHSASYAVESFQSLYLKTYYPLEFMVGVINNFGGFYKTEYYFHEVRMAGATIHAPCVNTSGVLTHIKDTDITIGFIHIHGLERALANRIVLERHKDGPYSSLDNFITRVDIKPDQMDLLIRINAFRFTGYNKYELAWHKNGALNPKARFEHSGRLFADEQKNYTLPDLQEGTFDQAFDEIELLGFPLRSPFDLLADRQKLDQTLKAKDLKAHAGKFIKIIGYYVCKKDTRTKHSKLMNFGTWLDVDGAFFDTVHFPQVLKRFPLRGKGIYWIIGKVVIDFGFPTIEVYKLELLPLIQDERYQ